VQIVLFSDFQCPYCAQLAPSIRQLQSEAIELGATIEFRNFPLAMHSNAQLAHQAAMAAKVQGRFWEMHDLLFANQARLQRSDLLGYAARLRLDMTRFQTDLDSDGIRKMIAVDVEEGTRLGVSGTPTYTISGKPYSGTRTFDRLKDLITAARGRARALAEITDDLMSKGASKAPVMLELFVDLQSPVSPPAVAVVNQLLQRYPTSVRVQFRNFPLAFHPMAAAAHEAAMIAAHSGCFWEFSSFLLAHQDSLREQDLIAFAGRVGLDEAEFAETMRQHRYAPRVEADVQSGLSRGVRGSPAILVNDRRIDGVPNLEVLADLVEAALKGEPVARNKRP
jgi:protein-disulfide isomerase